MIFIFWHVEEMFSINAPLKCQTKNTGLNFELNHSVARHSITWLIKEAEKSPKGHKPTLWIVEVRSVTSPGVTSKNQFLKESEAEAQAR